VDLELTEEQVDLQEGVRKLCEGRFPMTRVRETEGRGIDRSSWKELAEAGVFSLRLPETSGGVGLGAAEAVLVFEELGRALVPGPLVATELAARLASGAATGDEVVGVVERGSGPVVVEHLASLDRLVVLDDDGVWSVDPAALGAQAVERPLDPLTPVHTIDELPQGERIGDPAEADRWRVEGAALTAAQLLGMAAVLTELSVEYAKERKQFDRPIGGFQAVKHLLADMLVRAEVARAAVYAAGVTLDDPVVGDPRRAVCAAKLAAGEAAVRNGKVAVQVHGGMGFTWEVDAHLYLKRAWVLETSFGSGDDQAELMASML
jgi:alkylation response protein AidB-like acyl-CoA dehydrogenase